MLTNHIETPFFKRAIQPDATVAQRDILHFDSALDNTCLQYHHILDCRELMHSRTYLEDMSRVSLTSNKEYSRHYNLNQHFHDQILLYPKKSGVLLLDPYKGYTTVIDYSSTDNADIKFNRGSRVFYTIHTKHHIDIFVFVGNKSDKFFNEKIIEQQGVVRRMVFNHLLLNNSSTKYLSKKYRHMTTSTLPRQQNITKTATKLHEDNTTNVIDFSPIGISRKLTYAESVVLLNFIENPRAKNISTKIGISDRTVEHHLKSIRNKLNIGSKKALLQFIEMHSEYVKFLQSEFSLLSY